MLSFVVDAGQGAPCPVHLIWPSVDADLGAFTKFMALNRDVVLGLDTETNARDPWNRKFQVRLVQISNGTEAWLMPPSAEISALMQQHPRFTAHFSEAEIRFLGRDPIMQNAVRMMDSDPHILDTQPILGHYDPATLLPTDDKKIDPRLRHAKGLKETYEREFSPVLKNAETALHHWFAANAPKGHRTKKASLLWGFANVSLTQAEYLLYGALDAIAVKRLYDKMMMRLSGQSIMSHVRRDLLIQWDCDRMTFRGLPVDPPYVRWLDKQLRQVIALNTAALAQLGIKPSGQGDAVSAAFGQLGVAPLKMTAGSETAPPKPSWDKDTLEQIRDTTLPVFAAGRQLARTLITSRQAGKFAVTYVEPMVAALDQGDGAVHCSFRAVGTVTHRHSAANPPLQQQPKKDTRVRAAYGGRAGWLFVSCDFSQGEPRTMAALSGDPAYVAAVLSGDVNNAAATAAFGAEFNPAEGKKAGSPSYFMRQGAKQGFLAKCYGGGAGAIDHHFHLGLARCAEVSAQWDKEYAVLFNRASTLGRQEHITLPTGRSVILWDRKFWRDGRVLTDSRPSRKALNYETQGTQRDYLMAAWMKLRPRWQHYLAFFLHDEIILYVPDHLAEEARSDLQEAMTMDLGNGVRMECEATIDGRTWLPQPTEFDERELSSVDTVSGDG